MAEIALCTSIDAIGADARFRDVEIHFHDAALAPEVFDQEREIRLERLAHIAAALDQEDVLRGLLADRRTATDAAGARCVHTPSRSPGCRNHGECKNANLRPRSRRAPCCDRFARAASSSCRYR